MAGRQIGKEDQVLMLLVGDNVHGIYLCAGSLDMMWICCSVLDDMFVFIGQKTRSLKYSENVGERMNFNLNPRMISQTNHPLLKLFSHLISSGNATIRISWK